MKKYNPTEFENMTIEILMCGKDVIWKDIEEEKNALKRCRQRRIWANVINKIEKEK